MKKIYRLCFVLFVLLTTVGCDQTTKEIARQELASRPPVSLLNDSVLLIYTRNSGALLGFGAQLSAELRFLFFVVMAGLILSALFVFILKARSLSITHLAGLSLLAAGGVGNLIDRILNNGSVVDFIRLKLGFFHTGIFNLADVAIFLGISIFLYSTITEKQRQRMSS